ncbi:glutamate ABC superfamily ATP binding cassette transporter, ABC protein [Streptococcus sanguinis SK160]|uniref:Glutamate ABC superfamily ATP binding cassette transporter, ABC protein n=3 Tax=Streptococcus TaxID=1301 RepID=F0IW06_STRSA|nr:glutamate ABC superfamily ATP binding cassette transporter, ABC protein [Streptococcus sanguinis SK115]EGD38021.1 glutamate ABC superfamily ATP binding cassette transporter, ABC protein [Streptococcus sanguinis SK160]
MDNSHLKNFFPKWKYSFLFNLTVYLFYGKIYVILSNTKEKDMALVEFKNVEKYYGDYHALRNINLSFEKGQVVVLLGPSGSGKSTLIRTINALEDIDQGSLIVNGHEVTNTAAKDLVNLRKEVGMVFQHFNLYPHKTVLENVTLAPIKVLGMDKQEANKIAQKYLEFVNMWDKKDSYPGMLSGGQKQRIAIARGLAMHPELLLFDEPTSALDPETIGDVLAVMQKLAKDGMNMIVVTHEMGFAREVADRIIFMADGEVLVDTTDVDAFFDNPTEPRAKQFLSKIINHESDNVLS